MLKIHFPALVLQIKIYLIIPLLRYCPQPNPYRVHPVSRNARCAAFINEVLDRAPDADHMLDDMIHWPDNPKDAWYNIK